VIWSADQSSVQSRLADIHDLDFLLETVRRTAYSSGLAHWQETIDRERAERIATYRQLTLGATSLWNQWRLGLPTNGHVAIAADARMHATARAADPHLRKSAGDASIEKTIFDQLRRYGTC